MRKQSKQPVTTSKFQAPYANDTKPMSRKKATDKLFEEADEFFSLLVVNGNWYSHGAEAEATLALAGR